MKDNNMYFTVDTEDRAMICFQFHHYWHRIHEDELELRALEGYGILYTVFSEHGVFQLMRISQSSDHRIQYFYKLVKFIADEETGKITIYAVDLCEGEAEEVCRNPKLFIHA